MPTGEWYNHSGFTPCGGCDNLHISPSTGARLMHTKAPDTKDQDTKEVIPVDWIVDYLKAEVDKGLKGGPFLVAYGMIILAAWRKETGEV